ncbi:MFS transporter [Jannaschia pagri]|uniref:MFS transporter n=1 Tax=Jannaschia pagri TaxID=2829797 RepID=A0ABQ4NPD3_9RHOB|nr:MULTISPECIES: MFS transporter [unclassified Jannaschia]GIT92443.1 MFS transporter [Jannaschia sp. AI_61]GIT96278.1 MFS transporter [Jannaschia sp. AI_62]
MLTVLRNSWALLFGVLLLMMGNGIQGTLLGVRGEIEGFSTGSMSIIMSSYFAGFLLGSQLVPDLIRKVGHVRVFAALGSLASAGLIVFPAVVDPIVWTGLRLLLGFCFCGVYIVAESWLNNTTSNDMRGRALSLYLIAQMTGVVLAQGVFAIGDAADFHLFITVSVLVSLAFAPILLSASPVPPFETTEAMSFRELYQVSPLGFVGMLLLGGMFSAMFGMAGVYGALIDLSAGQIAVFVSAIYAGGMLLQYPIGWLSDRMDRRQLVVAGSVFGGLGCALGFSGLGGFGGLLVAAFVMGGVANPLYGLLLAYTNDFLDPEDMASASARLLFVNGVGAIGGPLLTGWLMDTVGPRGFWLFVGVLMAALAGYALWRMTRRPAVEVEDSAAFVGVMAGVATPVTMTNLVDEWEEQLSQDAEAET